MAGHGAILSYHANKNCFVNLPSGWVSKLNRDKIIVYELQAEGGSLFTSWAGGISVSSNNGLDTVEVNGLFAIKHNINHGDELLIREVYPVPACTQVFVEPLSITDWEILEENSQHIENNMLSQVRVVWIGQIIPLWIQKSICIFVKIGKTVPQSKCCLLEQNTEVIVMPKVRNMHQHAPTDTSGKEMSGESDYAGDVRDQVRDRCDFKSGDSDNHNDRLDVEGHNSSDVNPNQIRTRHLSGNKFVEDLRKAAVDYEEVTKSRRSSICSCSDNNREEDKGCSSHTQNTQPDSLMGKTVTFMKWLWSGERSTQTESPLIAVEQSNQKPYNKEYLDGTFDCGLRVQSLDSVVDGFEGSDNTHVKRPADLQWQHNNLLLHQPCNVFITQKTFAANYVINSRDFLPRTFLATLTKLLSPAEKQDLANKRSQAEKEQLAKMARQLASPASGSKELLNPEQEDKTNFVVRIVILEHGATFEKVPGSGTDPSRSLSRASDGHVMMPDALRCQLNLEVTAKVRVTAFKHDDCVPTRITCHPLFTPPPGYTSDMLLSAITSWVEMTSDQCCPLVMNKETVINIPLKPDYSGYFLLTCTFSADQDSHYCLLDMTTLQRIKLVMESEIPQQKLPIRLRALSQGDCCHMDLPVPKINLDQLGGVAAHIQQAVLHIDMCLAQRPLTDTMFTHKPGLHNGGLLLCGQKGLGKSSLASALCRYASRWPNWAYVVVVHCKSLKGKRIENIRKLFEKVFHEAVWRQPSVILLDDLDHVTAAPSGPEQEMSGEALYYTRVSEALKDILNETMRNNAKVIAIATSRSRSSIHPSLVASRGKHYFQEFLEMRAPNKTGRVAILKSILLNKPVVNAQCIDVLDLDSLAGRTEGHVPGDLDMVVDRAIHAHRMHPKSDDSDELNLCEADFDLALTDFVPTSLKSVTLHKPGEVGWQNIGGLTHVKKTLIETLQWPAKYSKLFASCPLRLRSGLLLYGAPGTGKTLLAGAVAKECGLNFISIKGPELLSKYIGASEQAVRDTFLRAQSAKPCILFFDEFDSLAPRRGHDSTGVTDRVVNQLLTQLDGVEGLEGVYVLGATSRPDLLDPALLRPGRLDKALYCPIPEQHERLEILHSLTHKMNLDPSVDLAHFAEACEGYTGADLKALLYNAQLESIHELTGYSSVTSDRTQLSRVTAEPRQLSNMTAGQPSPADDNRDGQTADTDNLTLVIEKIPVKRLSYIKKLEDGCLTLTPEEEQQHLSQFSDIVAPSSECANKDSAVTVIKQCHLVKALEGMRPSVSAEERKKYQMIYEHFVGSRGGNFTMERSAIGKKATLA